MFFLSVLDDILSASFFSNSPRRAHERVKSLLELARFLIPATVQAWNRALGRYDYDHFCKIIFFIQSAGNWTVGNGILLYSQYAVFTPRYFV